MTHYDDTPEELDTGWAWWHGPLLLAMCFAVVLVAPVVMLVDGLTGGRQ